MSPRTLQVDQQESRSEEPASHHGSQQLIVPQHTDNKRFPQLRQRFQRLFRPKSPGQSHPQYIQSDTPQGSGGQGRQGQSLTLTASLSEGIQSASFPVPSATPQAMASTFHGARDFTINGNPHFTNVGKYIHGGVRTHGLNVLKEFVSFSALHDSSTQDPDRRCHPGTREAVLKQMRDWIKDHATTKRILWLHGPAGVGKSAIAQTIAQSFGPDEVVATFFFFRSDSSRNDGNCLFPTLAWQVAKAISGASGHIARALENDCDIPRKTIEIQFERLISQPFQAVSEATPSALAQSCVVIIDGVDECSDEKLQRRFLNILGKAVGNSRFLMRFLISSRPESHIQDVFRPFQSTTLCIDLASIGGWRQDISTYLGEEFARIAAEQKLDSSTWPGEQVIEDFVSKSCGQFVYASTIIRFVGDEYSSATSQLKIVLGLKPSNGVSPFAELDALYIEILRRQHDHEFLKDMLSLLVARNSINGRQLGKDDAMLLDLDENELHRKLRGMHSVLKFEPLIDVHHRSFLDFLQDPPRSSQYHISEREGVKRYLELMVETIVRHASKVIKDNVFESFKPEFPSTIYAYPPVINLPVQDWEEALLPLSSFQDTLLELPHFCSPWKRELRAEGGWLRVFSEIQLQLSLLRITCHSVPPSQHPSQMLHDSCLSANMATGALEDEARNQWGRCPSPGEQRIPEDSDGLDSCLSLLLASLRDVKLDLSTSTAVGLVRSLLRFDPAEAASKIRSSSDARNLVDLIFCLIKGDHLLSNCDPVARQNARQLAAEIYARIPLFPHSLFIEEKDVTFEGTTTTLGKYQGSAVKVLSSNWSLIDPISQGIFTWATLSHENICPFIGVYVSGRRFFHVCPHGENGTLREWRQKTNPSVNEIQGIVLGVAKAIQYMHFSGICLSQTIKAKDVIIDSNYRARIPGRGLFLNTCSDLSYHLRSDLSCFGRLFYEIYFNTEPKNTCDRPSKPEMHDEAWQLIQRCCPPDSRNPLSMDEVVKEMESWK